jgi:hypothetical protein
VLLGAISLFRLGAYSYETFHATHPWDDIALFHFSTTGIVGLMLFTPLPADSSTSEEDSLFFDSDRTVSLYNPTSCCGLGPSGVWYVPKSSFDLRLLDPGIMRELIRMIFFSRLKCTFLGAHG